MSLQEADIHDWLLNLVNTYQLKNHRPLLVVSGEASWCQARAERMLQHMTWSSVLWLGQSVSANVNAMPANKVLQVLGGEYDAVVYDAYQGFDADAFAAVAGTIRGGGVCILLTPPLTMWPSFNDPVYSRLISTPTRVIESAFIARFIRFLQQQPAVYCLTQTQTELVELSMRDTAVTCSNATPIPSMQTFDQTQAMAVAAVVNVVKGHRRRPLVLTADRGRGKSAALGMAAAQLLQQGVRRILVTGPHLEAVNALFKHVGLALPEAVIKRGQVSLAGAMIEFIPADVLIAQSPLADCVMVDEAAALPNAMLEQLLARYSRLVFSTTVHGYEGTGRGFALRFFKTLDQTAPGWKLIQLEQAFRWAENDPLEEFIFNALLLKNDIKPPLAGDDLALSRCVVERISAQALAVDEDKLNQVFGLLVLAHYRTRPNDLRQLLDSPDVSVYVASRGAIVVAVALVINEGVLDLSRQEAVYRGERRLQGHLLAQTLLSHLGLQEVGVIKFSRIMRVAVHPELQRLGLGSQLLETVVQHLHADGCDMVGTSFAATTAMVAFWRKHEFELVRLGLTREHTTGCHGGVMLRALTNDAESYLRCAKLRFSTSWPHLLRDSLKDLDADLILTLSALSGDKKQLELTPAEWQEVDAFANGYRGFEVSQVVLDKLTWQVLVRGEVVEIMDKPLRDLWLAKLLQNKSWSEVVLQQAYRGVTQATDALRQVFRILIKCYRSKEFS